MIRRDFLPYCLPSIGQEEIDEVVDTLRSGWLSMGPKTLTFEQMVAEYADVKHAVCVNSCTAALHLCLLGYDIGPGDEVITTPYTFAATGNTIVHVGAKPVFVDVLEQDFNIDPELVKEKITKRTKAIVPVHFAGQPCDMNALNEIAEDHHLIIIEDAAHAIGSRYRGKKIGAMGNPTCYSFYATKNMTTGEGGAVVTEDDRLAARLKTLRLHGISKDAWQRYSAKGSWYYEIEEAGWKYNMTDLQAAIGMHQISKLDGLIRTRRELAERYNRALGSTEKIRVPTERKDLFHAYHLYPLLVPSESRGQFIDRMKQRNIGTSVHFIPLHLHPFYAQKYGFKRGDYPVAEYLYDREVSLPLYPGMTDQDVDDIVEAVNLSLND